MRARRQRLEDWSTLANGVLIGAGTMYLMDPDRGRRRRAEVRNQGVHLAHRLEEATDTASRDLRNRVRGRLAETRGALRRDGAPDPVIEARVRSALGRLSSHPGAIQVRAFGGEVTLSGPVLAEEEARVVRGIARVRGVRAVRNELTGHESPRDVPGLQGTARRPAPRAELLQENWAPGVRLVTGVLSGALTARGLGERGPLGMAMVAIGGGLLARSLTNLELRRITGVAAGRRAIDIHKTIIVEAPLERVFDFWADFTNLPMFMSHLREVRTSSGGRSHWTAQGPAGTSVSWDAEITAFEPQRLIAWKSLGTTPVNNAGIVKFQEAGQNATRVEVRMSYNPPAGAIGHLVASVLGVDPKSAMDEDLVRFKSLLEDGKTTAEGREIRRADVRSGSEIALGSD